MKQTEVQGALFEHRFWLQILGDHARFIKNTLSPQETGRIEAAQEFIDEFDKLLEQARSMQTESGLGGLTRASLDQTNAFRTYKLDLLRAHLDGNIVIGLSPTFINHMVNELDEYLRILTRLENGEPAPRFHPLHHHQLWLQDAYGHAASIGSLLDMTEEPLIRQSRKWTKTFESLYLKAVEFTGYLRTSLIDFPALRRFTNDAEAEMKVFSRFLQELEQWRLTKETLGVLMPLMADHMFREECYYLTKLAESGWIHAPGCDPTKPRQEM